MLDVSLQGPFCYLHNVHKISVDCMAEPCVVHNPSGHHMRDWDWHWRSDRGILERTCHHGVGHPDPDQSPYWNRTNQHWRMVHGCCGCCNSDGEEN